MKYNFSVYDEFSEWNVVMNFEAATLEEVRENFELFLRGAGFHPDSIKEVIGESKV